MRTCPACGKDTDAETTEPCTECGFSPVAPDEGDVWDESVWAETQAPDVEPEVTVGGPAPEPPAPAQAPAPQAPAPAPPPQPTKRKSGVGAIWIVLIVIGLAWQGFNLFNGCGNILDGAPGPTAEETESALVSDAALQGLVGAEVECPDSAEDTEVGDSFDCTITTKDGNSATVSVTNHEEEFTWSRQPFVELLREEKQGT